MTRPTTCATPPVSPATDRPDMLKPLLTSAVVAGGAAGLIAALLHFAFVQEYILLGEAYETGAKTHFAAPALADHPAAAPVAEDGEGHAEDAVAGAADKSQDESAVPAATRNGLTVVFTMLVYVSYGLVLVAAFGMIDGSRRRIGPTQGLLWGIAGFVTFQLAPAMGLPPELPGMIAAEIGARQFWWWGTVVATGTGLGLLALGPRIWTVAPALGLLALPHLIGAPHAEGYSGVAPPEVASAFAARALGVGLVAWSVLGWVAGYLWSRPAAD